MKTKMPEKSVRQLVKNFYQQRAERLHSLELDDITANVPNGLWSPEHESADKVVTRLIEAYLAGFEDWWWNAFKDTAFCVGALHLRRRGKMLQKFVYEDEFAYARNRLTLQFINYYCTADNEIDWKKIIVFNKRNHKRPITRALHLTDD